MTTLPLSRRTVLKGLGVSVALPFLEAMMPQMAFGRQARNAFPRRVAVCYVPNGVLPEGLENELANARIGCGSKAPNLTASRAPLPSNTKTPASTLRRAPDELFVMKFSS